MGEKSLVRRLMLPVSEYAKVRYDGTLKDTLQILDGFRKKIEPGQIPHRSVLVERRDGVFVGMLGYRAILGALRPQQISVTLDNMMRVAGVTEDMVSSSIASLEFFSSDLPSLCDRASAIRIRDLVLSRPKTIDVDESLHDVIDVVVNTQDSSLLVVENGDIVGVLRISDLFDEVIKVSLGEGNGDCAER